jgi:hypothetical protein
MCHSHKSTVGFGKQWTTIFLWWLSLFSIHCPHRSGLYTPLNVTDRPECWSFVSRVALIRLNYFCSERNNSPFSPPELHLMMLLKYLENLVVRTVFTLDRWFFSPAKTKKYSAKVYWAYKTSKLVSWVKILCIDNWHIIVSELVNQLCFGP